MASGSNGLHSAMGQVLDRVQAGIERLGAGGLLIAQTASAAALAWLLTALVFHHEPAFAPIGAVIAVEVTRGQQVRHAVELVLGVALGVGVATLLGSAIGSPPLRIAVVVALAMAIRPSRPCSRRGSSTRWCAAWTRRSRWATRSPGSPRPGAECWGSWSRTPGRPGRWTTPSATRGSWLGRPWCWYRPSGQSRTGWWPV
jgi:hypothetical protein